MQHEALPFEYETHGKRNKANFVYTNVRWLRDFFPFYKGDVAPVLILDTAKWWLYAYDATGKEIANVALAMIPRGGL